MNHADDLKLISTMHPMNKNGIRIVFIRQLKVEQYKIRAMYVKIIIIILSILKYMLKVHNVIKFWDGSKVHWMLVILFNILS